MPSLWKGFEDVYLRILVLLKEGVRDPYDHLGETEGTRN